MQKHLPGQVFLRIIRAHPVGCALTFRSGKDGASQGEKLLRGKFGRSITYSDPVALTFFKIRATEDHNRIRKGRKV